MSVASDIETAVIAIIEGLDLGVTVVTRKLLDRQENDQWPLIIVRCKPQGSEPGLSDTTARIRGFYFLDVVIYDRKVQKTQNNDFLEETRVKIRNALFQPIAGTLVDAIDPVPSSTADIAEIKKGFDVEVIAFKIETLEPLG